MCFTSFSTTEYDVYSLSWFFSAIRFWTRETTVSCHYSAETALTPLQFTCTALLYTLNSMHSVLTSTGTVSLDLSWHLYHGLTLSIRPTLGPYLVVPDCNSSTNEPLRDRCSGDIDKSSGLCIGVWMQWPRLLFGFGYLYFLFQLALVIQFPVTEKSSAK